MMHGDQPYIALRARSQTLGPMRELRHSMAFVVCRLQLARAQFGKVYTRRAAQKCVLRIPKALLDAQKGTVRGSVTKEKAERGRGLAAWACSAERGRDEGTSASAGPKITGANRSQDPVHHQIPPSHVFPGVSIFLSKPPGPPRPRRTKRGTCAHIADRDHPKLGLTTDTSRFFEAATDHTLARP